MMSRFQLQSPMVCFPRQSHTVPLAGKCIQASSLGWQSCTTVLKPLTIFLRTIQTWLAVKKTRTFEVSGRSAMDGNWLCKRYENVFYISGLKLYTPPIQNQRLKVGYNHIAWFHLDFAEGADLEIEMELFAYRFQEPPAFFRNIGNNHLFLHGIIYLSLPLERRLSCRRVYSHRYGERWSEPLLWIWKGEAFAHGKKIQDPSGRFFSIPFT